MHKTSSSKGEGGWGAEGVGGGGRWRTVVDLPKADKCLC